MKWRRKRKIKTQIFSKKLFIPLFLLLSPLIAALAIRSSIFVIKNLEIEPLEIGCATENQIKDSAALLGQNLLFVDRDKVEENLKREFICIRNISFSRKIPDKIILYILQREPAAVLIDLKTEESTQSSVLENIATPSAKEFNDSDKFLVDNTGVIFSKTKGDLNVPSLYVFGKNLSIGTKIEEKTLNNAIIILEKLKTFGLELKDVRITHSEVLIVYSRPKIIMYLPSEINIQLASLQLILEKAKIESNDLEFIDLRFDKPVVRFAPKK